MARSLAAAERVRLTHVGMFADGVAVQQVGVHTFPIAQQTVDEIVCVDNDEVWLIGCYISPYHHGSDANHDPERRRKLLLHRREIARLVGKVAERGLTLIPLRLYFKAGRAKIELGLARGKKLHDKRASLREREAKREMAKEARARQRA